MRSISELYDEYEARGSEFEEGGEFRDGVLGTDERKRTPVVTPT